MLIYQVQYTAMYYHMYMLYKKNVRDCSDAYMNAVAVGIVSGLASTGADQVVKQTKKAKEE